MRVKALTGFTSFLLFLALFIPGMISAQTVLPTNITSDFTLYKSNSPYRAESDVRVSAGATLRVEPGVTVEFEEGTGLYVNGRVLMEGTSDERIKLKTAPGNSDWEVVTLENTTQKCVFRYVNFSGSTQGNNSDRDRAALNGANVVEVEVDHVNFDNVSSCVYFHTTKARCSFTNSYFRCYDRGSVFFLVRTDALIQDCEFAGVVGVNSDNIDFDKVTADIIGNVIYGMTGRDCDGIDMGSQSEVYLKDNIIADCSDSGIESEEGSVITAENNVIRNCAIGITVKEKATGIFHNNTFVGNDVCFSAYSETGVNGNGGTIVASNNIIYQSTSNYSSRHGSSLTLTYNLTSSGFLSGTGNIIGDPLFVNPSANDFHLREGSPAIDAGDPNSPLDPDGTRADIGAFYFPQEVFDGLVFTEIHYNPFLNNQADNSGEFVEIKNISNERIDLTGFSISGDIQGVFPVNSSVAAGEYLLVVSNKLRHPSFSGTLIEWTSGNLGNGGGYIVLNDGDDKPVMELRYYSEAPWPERLEISNLSIELEDPNYNMEDPSKWRFSYEDGGTPGANNVRKNVQGVFVNELVSKYGTLVADEYGNYSDWVELYNSNTYPIYLMDLLISDDENHLDKFHLPFGNPDKMRIPPKGFIVLFADDNASLGERHVGFQLMSAGEQVCLSQFINGNPSLIDQVSFGPLQTDQSFGRYPDGSNNLVILNKATPGLPNKDFDPDQYKHLFVNEIVPQYGTSYSDEYGNYSDWIEIYNSGNEPIDLGGLYITDNLNLPTKYQITTGDPSVTTVPAMGFLVLFADAATSLGARHLSFQLSSGGEQVGLYYMQNDDLVVIDSVSFGPQGLDISYARINDGGANWMSFRTPTPGYSNSSTGIIDFPSEQSPKFRVFPNPTNQAVSVMIQGIQSPEKELEVMVVNSVGQVVRSFPDLEIFLQSIQFTWNLDSNSGQILPPGVYTMILSGSVYPCTSKIVVY